MHFLFLFFYELKKKIKTMHFFIIFYCMHVYIFLKEKKIHLEKNKNILIFFFL